MRSQALIHVVCLPFAAVAETCDSDLTSALQTQSTAVRHSVADASASQVDRVFAAIRNTASDAEVICVSAHAGEEAPFPGTFMPASGHKVEVGVGHTALESGEYCVQNSLVSLMQRATIDGQVGNFEAVVAGKGSEKSTGGKNSRRRSTKPQPKEPKAYKGYEVIGDGACATGEEKTRSSGEYTCLDGAHTGCAGKEEPMTDADGFMMCPGPDNELNTEDDTYLECAETDHTQDDCIEACSAKSGCNGVEYKVASHTKKSVCELHYTSIDGWKDSVWFNRKEDGTFGAKPDGKGFRKGKECANCTAEISMQIDTLADCQGECAKHNEAPNDWCTGIEYESPQVAGVGKGDCEVQFAEFSHFVKGSCYKKLPPTTTATTTIAEETAAP